MPAMLNRLKRDPFFFGLILIFLWFASFSLAVTFYLFRDPLILAATVVCCAVACLLFRWRQT